MTMLPDLVCLVNMVQSLLRFMDLWVQFLLLLQQNRVDIFSCTFWETTRNGQYITILIKCVHLGAIQFVWTLVPPVHMPTLVTEVIFFIWAYVPEAWLHAVGIFYYPSRYWALALPSFCMVIIALGVVFYIGLNFMSTPPPTSLNVMYDEYTREVQSLTPLMEEDNQPIEPISDIGIDEINDIMFSMMD